MTSSRTPDPAERVAAPAAATADADRVPPLRLAFWIAIALVLATGVALYFRHRADVSPMLGVAAEAGRR